MKFSNNVLCLLIIDFHKFLYTLDKSKLYAHICAYTFNISYLKHFFPI